MGQQARRPIVTMGEADVVVAGDYGGWRTVASGEDTKVLRRDDLAPAPAGERGADEIQRRGEAQEHQPEKFIRDGVTLVLLPGLPLSILPAGAAVPHLRLDLARVRGRGVL